MKFIGNNCEYNNIIRDNLNDIDYTIVSNIGGDYTKDITDDKVIMLMPIHSLEGYTTNTGIGLSKMIESGFGDSLKIYTTIYLYMHEQIDPVKVADIINTFDKNNLVDNIWLYPTLENYVLRDNNVENLAWQKLKPLNVS
jgi:hypothetical protein